MKTARMQIGVDFLDQREISRTSIIVEILDVEREITIDGEASGEAQISPTNRGALYGIIDDVTAGGSALQ